TMATIGRTAPRAPGGGALARRGERDVGHSLLFTGSWLLAAAPAGGAALDLELLDGPTAIKMMEEGKLSSVKLTKAYLARIDALNKRGPGLNAVTQLNRDALAQAAQMDEERRRGQIRGPAHGLPVLLKDLI